MITSLRYARCVSESVEMKASSFTLEKHGETSLFALKCLSEPLAVAGEVGEVVEGKGIAVAWLWSWEMESGFAHLLLGKLVFQCFFGTIGHFCPC